ncbi:DUF859 family phage minor structural protein [Faecousia sp.]|uniref:DUF859 family phage minor structural protein n=1 Tax=Faecousia sp. TaxID=2952921 RepID=UPI003AB78558
MQYDMGSNRHAYVKRTTSSDWDSSGAVQGAYGNDYPRVGVIRYEGLRNSVIWADQEISEIAIGLRFLAAGSDTTKTLTFWRGAKSVINGTGQSMIGSEMGSISVSNAYNGVRTIELSETTNASLFNAFVSWLKDGQTETLAIYRNEGAGSGRWSSNYLKIDATTLHIEYEPKGSKGTLNRTSVDAGQNVSLTIDPLDVSGTVTHRVQWSFGSASSSVTELAAGETSADYTIPMDWCSQLPNAVSGQAVCTLTTLVDGVVSATREIPFAVMVPTSVVPSYSFESTPYETTGGYYQHIGKALLSIENAASQYGATITACRIAGGESTDASASSVITDVFEQSGDHVYTATVTDSRGRTTVKTLTLHVMAVSPISISSFLVQRYSEIIGDDGLPYYVATGDGDHVWVSLLASHDPAGGNNQASAAITWGASGSASLPWGTVASITYTNDRTVITAQIPANTSVLFKLTVSDGFSSATASSQVELASAIMHVSPNGVGIGMYTLGTPSNRRLDIGYPVYAHVGIAGVTIYTEDEQPTGGVWIDGRPIYRKSFSTGAIAAGASQEISMGIAPGSLGDIVSIRGSAKLAGADYWNALPHVDIGAINTWGIKLEIANASSVPTVSVSMGSGRSIEKGYVHVEYTKNTDADSDGMVTIPPGSMTGENAYGCAVTASGAYTTSNSYRPLNAFDRNLSSIWASNASGARWLQLEMPVALTNIVVEVYEQSGVVLHPVAGTVQGSNDGADWTEIGNFANWNTVGMGADGLLGTISCGNSTAYRYVRLNITACVNNQQCDVAEMRVRGKP